MRKQNQSAKKFPVRLCAALCVWLLCAGFLYPAPGRAAEPVSTPVMIRRPARSPAPDPAGGLPVFVMVYYVNERGTVVREEKRRLTESCLVEAAPEELPDDYELADSTAVYVLAENGTASPAYVEFSVRKKTQPSPVQAETPSPAVFVPVYYVTDQGTVLSEGKVRITASGTIQADPGMVPEAYELTGKTDREVRLENGIAEPASVEFTVRRKAAQMDVPHEQDENLSAGPDNTAGTPGADGSDANRPMLGVTVTTVSGSNGILPNGALVMEVSENSNASRADIRKGDVIVSVNDTVITSSSELVSCIQNCAEGDTFTVKLYRAPGMDEAVQADRDIDLSNVGEGSYLSVTVTFLGAAAETGLPAGRKKSPLSDFRTVGNIVRFGYYEQDDNTANGPEEIEWIVLDVQGSKALLLSRYGLDAKRYTTGDAYITWEKCTLRTWLNGEFMSSAFSPIEQGAILTTAVDNSRSQGYSKWSTDGGNNTRDKIFLLSYAEANKYLGVTYDDKNNTKSRVMPTDYAVKQGALISDNYMTDAGASAGWWWLRSPGSRQGFAASVFTNGALNLHGGVYTGNACVRPALWIDLNSGIF